MQRERAYHEQVKTLPTSRVCRDDVPFSYRGHFLLPFSCGGIIEKMSIFMAFCLSDLQYVVHCLGC